MSKFIQMLEKVGQRAPAPMGFGPASRREEQVASIALVGEISAGQLRTTGGAAEAGADATLVVLESWSERTLDRAAKSLEGQLWGVRLSDLDAERVERLKSAGCDFVVFDPATTSAASLADESLGKIVDLGSELVEDIARGIQNLPVDGVLWSPAENLLPLTVQRLMDVQMARALVDRPFVLRGVSEVGSPELRALRDADVTALLLDAAAADDIGRIKEEVSNLPPRSPRPRPRGTSVARVPGLVGADIGEEEEDDYRAD